MKLTLTASALAMTFTSAALVASTMLRIAHAQTRAASTSAAPIFVTTAEAPPRTMREPGPRNAIELPFASGYTKGFGSRRAAPPRTAKQLDPWVEAGGGYRFLWEEPTFGSTFVTHGLQFIRLRVAIDFRADDHVAMGAMVGADATTFMFQDYTRTATFFEEPRSSTFRFAGLQGRVDIALGGEKKSSSSVSRR